MNSISKIKIMAVVTFCLTFVACSEMKKVDEMKDNTAEMNQTTKTLLDKTSEMKDGLDKMSTATDEMNQSTKDLRTLTREELIQRLEDVNNSTGSLFDAMRQGDTSNLRRTGFAELLKQKTLQGRVAEAGLYLQGFEFQVLGNVGKDKSSEFREMLYHQAMLEFFLKIDEIAPKLGKIWPEAQPSKDDVENRASAFSAIAFALHQTNRQQHADPAYGKPMSVYDLIMVALKLKPDIDSGRIVLPRGPSFIKEVLSHPDRVEQLLQTRYNMFVYAMLGSTTNFGEISFPKQLISLVLKLNVDLSSEARGVAVLQRIDEEIATPAALTTADMLNIGITPKFSSVTNLVLSRIDFQFGSSTRGASLSQLWRGYVSANPDSLPRSRR